MIIITIRRMPIIMAILIMISLRAIRLIIIIITRIRRMVTIRIIMMRIMIRTTTTKTTAIRILRSDSTVYTDNG